MEYLILDFGFWFPPDKPCANRPGKEREEIPEEEIQALSLVRIFFCSLLYHNKQTFQVSRVCFGSDQSFTPNVM